jgi:hypothetical protein
MLVPFVVVVGAALSQESYKDRLLKRQKEEATKGAMDWQMEQEDRRKQKEADAAVIVHSPPALAYAPPFEVGAV